jgi:hypothetical protein
MKHTFTPEQSEAILNAVSELVEYDGGLFNLSQFVNDISRTAIMDRIEDDTKGNPELVMTANYLSEVLTNTSRIAGFFSKVESCVKQS